MTAGVRNVATGLESRLQAVGRVSHPERRYRALSDRLKAGLSRDSKPSSAHANCRNFDHVRRTGVLAALALLPICTMSRV